MDKRSRLFEICQSLASHAVSQFLREVMSYSDFDRQELFGLPNWSRIKNYSIQNKIAEFDGESPFNIKSTSDDAGVSRFLEQYVCYGEKIPYVLNEQKPEDVDLRTALTNSENYPLRIESDSIVLHKDWQKFFEPKSSESILLWMRNYYNIAAKFLRNDLILKAVQTSLPQWQSVFGLQVRAPFDLKNFNEELFFSLMSGMHQANPQEVDFVLSTISSDLSGGQVLDIGGATAALSRQLAERQKTWNITIYEKADSLPVIQKIITHLDLNTPVNLRYVAGDFFRNDNGKALFGIKESSRFDLIILGWIIHDWQDAEAIQILSRVKHHLTSSGQIFLLEKPLDENGLGVATSLDLTMLLQTGGCERTIAQYQRLAQSAGLKLTKHIPTSQRRDLIVLEAE